jgi:hypothetical protein
MAVLPGAERRADVFRVDLKPPLTMKITRLQYVGYVRAPDAFTVTRYRPVPRLVWIPVVRSGSRASSSAPDGGLSISAIPRVEWRRNMSRRATSCLEARAARRGWRLPRWSGASDLSAASSLDACRHSRHQSNECVQHWHYRSSTRLNRSRRNSSTSKRTPRYWTRRIPRGSMIEVRVVWSTSPFAFLAANTPYRRVTS